ncbi:MAG: hypothetical protein KHY83_10645 [Coriobacteriia bacterium]|nr:hypothetical protein [Coriobacteriia bacterium]MBS5479105.1 hypothetical protein [Coriobacteriia bacterium]
MKTDEGAPGDVVLREVLARAEAERAGEVPSFEQVKAHIARQAEPMAGRRWTFVHSARLAGALALAQLRVVPGLVAPVMVVMAVAAVLAALFAAGVPGSSGGASASRDLFATVLLAGVALTVTMAVGHVEHDAVSLATPLGPQVVTLTRLALVLALDVASGFVASVVLGSLGQGDVPAVLMGWLPPLALVAGFASLVAIWMAPWAGATCGFVLTLLVSPAVADLFGPAWGVWFAGAAASFWGMLGPVGMVTLGVAMLALTVATSRRALLMREAWAE